MKITYIKGSITFEPESREDYLSLAATVEQYREIEKPRGKRGLKQGMKKCPKCGRFFKRLEQHTSRSHKSYGDD